MSLTKADSPLIRSVVSRQQVGITASVIQRNDLLFHTFITDSPSIILLKRGKKTLTMGGKKITLLPGDAIAIAGGAICNVENKTDEGLFESAWIVCSELILRRMEKEFPNRQRLKGIAGLKGLGKEFIKAFERGVQSICTPDLIPDAVAENRIRELLAWLFHVGFVFDSNEPVSLQRKVRRIIGVSPEKKWLASELAHSLAMSEATFRRKLAQEGQSFNEILVDVRMTNALTLLQVSDTSISDIAYQVGYDSASRFSIRFKKRFGFSPNAIRGGFPHPTTMRIQAEPK